MAVLMKKKVAIYCIRLTRGGAERVSVYLAHTFVEKNWKCYLIIDEHLGGEYEVPNGVECIELKSSEYGSGFGYYQKMISLRNTLKRIQPDFFIIMEVPACFYAIPAAKGLNMKIIVSERNAPTEYRGNKIFIKVARLFMKYADGFVFQTSDAKQFYNKSLKGKGICIPNPLLVDNIPSIYRGERRHAIVNVGRLTEQKNQQLLIDGFAHISRDYGEYVLEIYGDGPLRGQMEQYVRQLGITEKVVFQGNVPDVLERINNASCFVLSSLYEGMPNALIEAMAMGLPVISTNCPCGGPKELIKDGYNGVLIQNNDITSLIHALEFVLQDQTRANEMGEKAVKIREELDASRVMDLWIDYLVDIENDPKK